MDVAAAKDRVRAEVDRLTPMLIEVSHSIHENPELSFEEHQAHDLLCRTLAEAGLDVEPHAYGLDTAFAARAGTEGPLIAVLCEYDALPGIGHACGHNVIAAAGLGAGLAAAAVADAMGGRLVVLGTPAEEAGGGKVFMARQGAFDGVEAALMVHPADRDLSAMATLAFHQLDVEYHGEASHAAAAPHMGRNALDAAVLGYMNVAALRQHIRPDERVHGVFVDGGAKPNVVPNHASTVWYVRSSSVTRLEPLKQRVLAALEAGAVATGCTVEHRWHDPSFADLIDNQVLLELYAQNAAVDRRHHLPAEPGAEVVGSTDMGNVSYLTPSIHPMIQVAPPGVAIHTAEFARHARGAGGDAAVTDGAKALAATVVDLWASPAKLLEARAEWEPATQSGRSGVI